MRSQPSPIRSRTRGQRMATGPMPVLISRSGRWPWRTSRWWPPSVSLSAWPLSKAATSASTACANSARAPLRKTSVSGSAKVPGWESWKTLVSVTAYHSFGGEVEASNTPTIRRLTLSCRHQLSRIALHGVGWDGNGPCWRGDAWRRLRRQIELELLEEELLLGLRLGVTAQDQGAAIGGREMHVEHLHGG